MRRLVFATNEYYHIYNRGVEKRDIFCSNGEYFRFVSYLYELNDRARLPYDFRYNFRVHEAKPREIVKKERDTMVDVIAFCLMPSHFHLILRQSRERGISQFMQKLGTAYTMYFNTKYERSGRLFQGTFKAVHVGTSEQFIHLTRYVHLNPLDLIEQGWKEKGTSDWSKAKRFLEQYRWSSYLNYIGKTNFPLIIDQEPLKIYFNDPLVYQDFVYSWAAEDLEKFAGIQIEP